MKEVNATVGGEGSGGVIYPPLHYGRDALVGIALFLTYLAKRDISTSQLRAGYPNYFMSKKKVVLDEKIDVDAILEYFWEKYQTLAVGNNSDVINISNMDGVKIDFENSWVHLRKSNTEPIMRIYTEAQSQDEAEKLAERFIDEINKIINK
jgi:phosphomannomutase